MPKLYAWHFIDKVLLETLLKKTEQIDTQNHLQTDNYLNRLHACYCCSFQLMFINCVNMHNWLSAQSLKMLTCKFIFLNPIPWHWEILYFLQRTHITRLDATKLQEQPDRWQMERFCCLTVFALYEGKYLDTILMNRLSWAL